MGKKDARVDAYIEQSADFARPILRHLRSVVHEGCPEAEETMKWSRPHFAYKGMFAGMAAFKQHCVLMFWKGELIAAAAPRGVELDRLGRIASVDDLPAKAVLVKLTRAAAALNEQGVKIERAPRQTRKTIPMPADFAAALKKSSRARSVFGDFSPTARRDYLEWITEARTGDTRQKRIETAVGWIAEGKRRNWKYEKRA